MRAKDIPTERKPVTNAIGRPSSSGARFVLARRADGPVFARFVAPLPVNPLAWGAAVFICHGHACSILLGSVEARRPR